MPLTHGDFEGQAIAKRGSILHAAILSCDGFECVRLYREGVLRIAMADLGLKALFLAPLKHLSSSWAF